MYHRLPLLLCLLAAVVLGHAGHDHAHDEEEHNENSHVVVLGDLDFEETVEKNQFVFAEFYAPWCGHCKRLAPDYEIVADHFHATGSPVVIAKVDATIHAEIAGKMGVRGYPTLKFFRNGQAVDYDGGRSADELIKWITKKTSSATTELGTSEKVGEFVNGAGLKVLGYLAADKVSAFTAVASDASFDDFVFAHVVDSALFGDNGVNTAIIYKPGESNVVFSGELTEESLKQWILDEGFPLYEELAQKIWQRSSTSQTPLLAVFAQEKTDEVDTLVKDLAKAFKGKVLSSLSTAGPLAERWGASGKVFPTAVLVNWKGAEPKLSVFDEDSGAFTLESGSAFLEAALKGEYKGYKKSEAVPETNDGPVKVIVGKTFEQIVNDPSKDVFVKFYAPWCGHCKNLAPVWEELGEAFKGTDVVIAKLDATANSYPENIEIQGFPTLLFFSADDKTGVPYNGDRDLESFKDFVKQQASRTTEKEDL